jgi:short subunit fatty acids transporter
MLEGLVIVVVIATVALVVGLGFGRVVAAPFLRRLADRLDADSDAPEESGDRPA